MDEIEFKLQELREEWKVNPSRRKIIEIQAKLLKMSLEKRKPVIENLETAEVEEIFADSTQQALLATP